MPAIALVALKDFAFDDREVVKGELFDVAPIQAAAFTYQQKAKFAPKDADSEIAHALAADVPEPDAPRSRRRYRRKDMQAEE